MEDKEIIEWILDNMPHEFYKKFLKQLNITLPHNKEMIHLVNKQLSLPSKQKKVNFILSKILADVNAGEKSNKADTKTQEAWVAILRAFTEKDKKVVIKKISEVKSSVYKENEPRKENLNQIVPKLKKEVEDSNLEKKIKNLEKKSTQKIAKYQNENTNLYEQVKNLQSLNRNLEEKEINLKESLHNFEETQRVLNNKLMTEKEYSRKKANEATDNKKKIRTMEAEIDQLKKRLDTANDIIYRQKGELELQNSEIQETKENSNGENQTNLLKTIENLKKEITKIQINNLQIEFPNRINNVTVIQHLNKIEVISTNMEKKYKTDFDVEICNDIQNINKVIKQPITNYKNVYIYTPELQPFQKYSLREELRKRNINYIELDSVEEFEERWK